METIEDKMWELYPDVPFKEDVSSEDTFRTNEIRFLERTAFLAGYNEAIRWRDIESDYPPYYFSIFIKVKDGNFYRFYSASLIKDNDNNDVFITLYSPILYIKKEDVVGWKYRE